MTGPRRLVAVVMAARGGSALATALDALSWADDRIVLDVQGRVPEATAEGIPVLRRADEVPRLGPAWIVVLDEAERIAPAGAASLREAVARASATEILALRVVTEGLGVRVATGRAARVGPPGCALALRAGMGLSVEGPGLRTVDTDVVVVRARGAALSEAVEQLDAEAGALAHLAVDEGGIAAMLWQPAVAATRILRARSDAGPLGLARWVLAVLEGYRVVVAFAKRWELRRDREVELT